ncbi:hypothetical protein AB205_0042950 [Aquarana catesbeiana]|uniref:Uncharacterized protein n=1 Tax=Aquarana catesbeiana TaxID=8400 RepID=A0A2G9NXA7_AQUCT|nr:hypothetical protein AB205_0042950 [Aquarana catesbeiana]
MRRRRQRAEEQESSMSATCSVIQSEGETQEEEAEAATPTSSEAEQEVEETCPVVAVGDEEEQPDAADPGSEVFILHLHLVDEGLDLPASGWADCPSSPAGSTGHVLLHTSSLSPHLDTPIGASSPVRPGVDSPSAPGPVHIPPPELHVNDYL